MNLTVDVSKLEDNIIEFGKYKGKTFKHVFRTDQDYSAQQVSLYNKKILQLSAYSRGAASTLPEDFNSDITYAYIHKASPFVHYVAEKLVLPVFEL